MRRLGKKIRSNKLNLSLKHKINGTLGVIYIDEVNFSTKNHLMHNYFNLNYLKGWRDIMKNTWNN